MDKYDKISGGAIPKHFSETIYPDNEKLKKIKVEINEKTFEPLVHYELVLPIIEFIMHGEMIFSREEVIAILGTELYHQLKEVHKNDHKK